MDGSFLVGAVLLALASAPLWFVNAIRRRRTLELLRAFRLERVTPPTEFADQPAHVTAVELRVGGEATGTWRPWFVRLLLGRNGVILGMDLALLTGLGLLAAMVDDRRFLGVAAAVASAPLASAVAAVVAMSAPTPTSSAEPSRRDVVAAWLGGFVLAATLGMAWLAAWLIGLGLILKAG